MKRITYAEQSQRYKGRRPHFQHIEEFASFPSPGKRLTEKLFGTI
jgi:hypothetical protein